MEQNWLNIKPEQLDTIKSNHPNEVEDCLLETIKEWLNGIDPGPTWEELVEAGTALVLSYTSYYSLTQQQHSVIVIE